MSTDAGRSAPEDGPGDESGRTGARCDRCAGEAARMVDAEDLNIEWSGVRPGVGYRAYIRGGFAAQRAAVAVCALSRCVKHWASLDRVAAMTDLDGRAYLRVDLNVAGVYDVVALVLDGLRFRGELVDGNG